MRRIGAVPGPREPMKLFGYNITRAKDISTSAVERTASPQGPYTDIFKDWIARKVQPSLYEAIREAIPIVDAALHRLVTLDGMIRFDGEKPGLVHEIEDWAGAIQVNDLQSGLQAFINNFSNETYEQGFSISEFVASPDMKDIVRLNVADSKDILFRRGPQGIEPWYRGLSDPSKTRNATDQIADILQGNLDVSQVASRLAATGYTQLTGGNILYYSIDNENHNPYGVSMLRSTEFVSKILLTMHNALLNTWERFGDPSYHVKYKTSRRDIGDTSLEDRRKLLADNFTAAVTAKREGRSADFVNAIDTNSDIEITVIGTDNKTLEFQVPSDYLIDQIISRFNLPPWVLGIHRGTTERLAKHESEILLQEAETRGANKLPGIKRIIETMLRFKGRRWKRDDWTIYLEKPNLHDLIAQAQARFLNAQADMYYLEHGLPDRVSEEGQGALKGTAPIYGEEENGMRRIGAVPSTHAHPHSKESRPIPHPEVREVEIEYQKRLTHEWDRLRQTMFQILALPSDTVAAPPARPVGASPSTILLSPRGEDRGEGGLTRATKAEDPPFTFTPEQRARIMASMERWIGEFTPDDPEGVLKWYYGQSYSLGLIQAAQLIGAARPILDIIKNSEIYNDLVQNGFDLLKNSATKTIVNRILPEMEAQVIAGQNPRAVASRLSKLFADANANWERLARSEMAMAAERAKIDEYKAEGVEQMHFYAAADACPICQALAGDYPVAEVPQPVRDTHPRCYCTLGPVDLKIEN